MKMIAGAARAQRDRAIWLAALLIVAVSAGFADGATGVASQVVPPSVWNAQLYHAILRKIHTPVFRRRQFNVRQYGALPGGKNCDSSFKRAIIACHAAGGGRVIVPPGTYICKGPITLLSNVNFHLDVGSQINFGFNPRNYLTGKAAVNGCVLVRYEGVWCYNYSPLIYAFRQTNVAVTGAGVLNGQRNSPHSTWMHWYNAQQREHWKDRLVNWGYSDHLTPMRKRIFGAGWHLMPEFCDFEQCRNVLVRGVTFKDSPFWTIHPSFCSNVIIEGVSVYNHDEYMDDGIDVDSCNDTLIQNCNIRNNDDNIVIKSGRNADAWSVNGGRPCKNVIIRHNWLSHDIGFGSEMSGGIKNVFAHDNQFGNGADIIYMKWGGERGGYIQHIYIRGVTADTVKCLTEPAISWAGGYQLPNAGFVPKISDWAISDVVIDRVESGGLSAISLVNLGPSPISHIWLENINIGAMKAHQPAVWLKNARAFHFINVTIGGHRIYQLHATAARVGRRVELSWHAFPGAAGYVIYAGTKQLIHVGPAADAYVFKTPLPGKLRKYIGVAAVLPSGMAAIRQDVKWPVRHLPKMARLRQLERQAAELLKQSMHAVRTVPMHFTPRQRAISHLYYCVHAGDVVLNNSTAAPSDAKMVEKMLADAIHAVRK